MSGHSLSISRGHASDLVDPLDDLLKARGVGLDGLREEGVYSVGAKRRTGIVVPELVLVLIEVEGAGVGDDEAVVLAGQQVIHQGLLITRS